MQVYGFDNVFEKFCELNKATKGSEHDQGKVRDKFTEIIDVTGIDKLLLKTKEKMIDANGKTIKGNSYIIPVECVDFCAEAINRYTSKNFKSLRSAAFQDTDISDVQFLIDGFSDMLLMLDCQHTVFLKQRRAMEHRMHYKIRLSEKKLAEQLEEIQDKAKGYENSYCNFNYDDKVYFLRYMAFKVEYLNEYLSSVYADYTDIRSDEISKAALEKSPNESNQESFEKINMELYFFEALEHDDKYQKLQKAMEKLIAEDTFIKNKQSRYKKLQSQIEEIRRQHQMKLFGKLLSEDPDFSLDMEHPLIVLKAAVAYTNGNFSDGVERDEKEASKTPSDIEKDTRQSKELRKLLESKGIKFDLPNTDIEETEIFMNHSNLTYKIKGMVSFPCCKKEKVIAYEGSAGKCAIKCPKCGQYALFDYDRMKATSGESLRGAAYIQSEK